MKSQFVVKHPALIRTVFLLSTALITGAIVTYTLVRHQSPRQDSVAIPVEQSVIPTGVAARGYLEPKGEVIHVSAPAFQEGARVDKLLVELGDWVTAGQVIAVLDSSDRLSAALSQAKAQVEIAQSRLAQVQAGAKQGDITAQDARFQGTKAELEGQIRAQRATIASLTAQRQGEISAQQAAIERIRAELANAETDCSRYQSLHVDGAVSEQERDRFCLQATTTEKSLNEAQANLNRIITTMDEQIKEAKANLDRTIVTLEQKIKENQGSLESIAEVRSVDVQVAQAELQASQATLKHAEAELAQAFVKAPKDGQILKINTWPGELVGIDGIVELGQTSEMYVTAEVYETDIHRVKLGQIAIIKTDGVTGELRGIVDEIGLQIGRKNVLGTDPVEDADARVVEVKIRLTPEYSQRVAGLTNLEVRVLIQAENGEKKDNE